MGLERGSPELDSETRIQALRGAAVANTSPWGHPDEGIPSASTFVLAFLQHRTLEE